MNGSSDHPRATSGLPLRPQPIDIRWAMSVFVPNESALPLKADVAAVGRESPKLTPLRHLVLYEKRSRARSEHHIDRGIFIANP